MFRFPKRERIFLLKEIEGLFERGRNSRVQCMPLQAVWQLRPCPNDGVTAKTEPAVKVMMSVAKKRLRHAVDRNRAKRQMREAYRLQHQQLSEAVSARGQQMLVAFVWLSDEAESTERVFEAMRQVLGKIIERLNVSIKP